MASKTTPVALLLACCFSAFAQPSYWFQGFERQGNAKLAQQYFFQAGSGIFLTYTNPYVYINSSGGSGTNAGPPGPSGPQGPAGINGSNGLNGVNGTNGSPGAPGVNGTNGVAGLNGTNGVNGTNGLPGLNGTNGLAGINGTNGVNGTNGLNGANGTNAVTSGITTNAPFISPGPLTNWLAFVSGSAEAFGQAAYIITQPISLATTPGGNLTFNCVADGLAPIAFIWKTNGVQITDGGVVSGSGTSNLTFTAITTNYDSLTLTCLVSNIFGSQLSSSVGISVTSLFWPTNYPNLVWWSRADSGMWDGSGGTPPPNNATVQSWTNWAAAGSKFTWNAGASGTYLSSGGPAGKPAYHGSGIGASWLSTATMPGGPVTNFTYYLIFKCGSDTLMILDTKDSAYRCRFHWGYFPTPYVAASTTIMTPFWDATNNWSYVTVSMQGVTNGNAFLRTNGVLVAVGTCQNQTPTTPVQIQSMNLAGDTIDNGNWGNGYYYEWILYQGSQTTNQIQTVEAYLRNRIAGVQ